MQFFSDEELDNRVDLIESFRFIAEIIADTM